MSDNNTSGRPENPWDKKELGVLWHRETSAKDAYLTGVLKREKLMEILASTNEDIQLVCFSNKNKSKDTHPDLRIYLSEKRKSATEKAPTPAPKASTKAPAAEPQAKPVVTPSDDDLI